MWVVLVQSSHESMCQSGLQDPLPSLRTHMVGQPVWTTGRKSYDLSTELRKSPWNMVLPKETKWKPTRFHDLVSEVICHQHSAPLTAAGVGRNHRTAQIWGGGMTGGHRGGPPQWSKARFWRASVEGCHTNSRPVCILHPSDRQRGQEAVIIIPSPYLWGGWETNSSTTWWCSLWYQWHRPAAKGTQRWTSLTQWIRENIRVGSWTVRRGT